MIRINLLPYKGEELVQWGQRQVLIFVVAVLVAVVTCVILYKRRPDPEAEKKRLIAERATFERRTGEEQAKVTCDQEALKKKIKREKRKYKAVEELITKRRTPKHVLRELTRILSESWGPTLRKNAAGVDKRTLYNQNWDPTSVWLVSVEEKGGAVKIEGGAKAADDIAEFTRRLQVSAYFADVELERFSKVSEVERKLSYLKFNLAGRVHY